MWKTLLNLEDQQLVIVYKDFRTYNDPSYEFKNEYFDRHKKYSLNIDGIKVIFDTFYKNHIGNGNLVLKDMNDNPITEYFGINGRFFVALTPKGIDYIENKYPFLK